MQLLILIDEINSERSGIDYENLTRSGGEVNFAGVKLNQKKSHLIKSGTIHFGRDVNFTIPINPTECRTELVPDLVKYCQALRNEIQVSLLGYEQTNDWHGSAITQLKRSCDNLISNRGYETVSN